MACSAPFEYLHVEPRLAGADADNEICSLLIVTNLLQ